MRTRRQRGGNRAAALKVLGLPDNASENNIKKAYRKKSLIYHPDREGGNTKLFQRLGAAYEFLTGERNSFNNNNSSRTAKNNARPTTPPSRSHKANHNRYSRAAEAARAAQRAAAEAQEAEERASRTKRAAAQAEENARKAAVNASKKEAAAERAARGLTKQQAADNAEPNYTKPEYWKKFTTPMSRMKSTYRV